MRLKLSRTIIILTLLIALLSAGCQQPANPPNSASNNAPATTVAPAQSPAASSSTPAAPPTTNVSEAKPAGSETKKRGIEEISFKDIKGREYTYKDIEGKVVLFVYWATWCGPCLREIPSLNQLHERYSPRGAMIIAISQDDQLETLQDFLTNRDVGKSIKYPIVYGLPYIKTFGRKGAIPTVMLLNRKGELVAEQAGALPLESLAEAIEHFL